MEINLHGVPCVICEHTNGVLHIGRHVQHGNRKCQLVPYRAAPPGGWPTPRSFVPLRMWAA